MLSGGIRGLGKCPFICVTHSINEFIHYHSLQVPGRTVASEPPAKMTMYNVFGV